MEEFIIQLSPFDWNGVSGISNVLLVILNAILVGSIVVGYRSVKQAVLARDAEMLIWAVGQIDEIKPDLRTLRDSPPYSSSQSAQPERWDADSEDAAEKVSVRLQRLSYMALAGLISKPHLIEMWGPTFSATWAKLEPWVRQKRLQNGEPPAIADGAFSRKHLEIFAAECAEFERNQRQSLERTAGAGAPNPSLQGTPGGP